MTLAGTPAMKFSSSSPFTQVPVRIVGIRDPHNPGLVPYHIQQCFQVITIIHGGSNPQGSTNRLAADGIDRKAYWEKRIVPGARKTLAIISRTSLEPLPRVIQTGSRSCFFARALRSAYPPHPDNVICGPLCRYGIPDPIAAAQWILV